MRCYLATGGNGRDGDSGPLSMVEIARFRRVVGACEAVCSSVVSFSVPEAGK